MTRCQALGVLLAADLHRLPRPRRLRLLVHPDTTLRWHRRLHGELLTLVLHEYHHAA